MPGAGLAMQQWDHGEEPNLRAPVACREPLSWGEELNLSSLVALRPHLLPYGHSSPLRDQPTSHHPPAVGQVSETL